MLLLTLLGCLIDDEDQALAYDRDGDGYIAEEVGGDDCDDDNKSIHPDMFEDCLDSIDSDCDGQNCPVTTPVAMGDLDPILWGEEYERLEAYHALADVDGDGARDLLISAPGANDGDGRIYFLPGPIVPDALRLGDATVIEGSATPAQSPLGLRVGGVGDVDGDGADEVFISALVPEGAQVHMVDGWPDPAAPYAATLTVAPTVLPQNELDEINEFFLAGGAVVMDEAVLIMAPLNDRNGGVYLYRGPLSGSIDLSDPDLPNTTTLTGEYVGDFFGGGVSNTADLNGDGVQDVLSVSPGFDLLDEDGEQVLLYEVGAVYGFFGGDLSADRSAQDADLRLLGAFAEAHIERVSGIGNLDKDGYEDIMIFSHTGPGDVEIFCGPLEGVVLTSEADLKLFGDGTAINTEDFGMGATAEDLNQDGHQDLLIPAPGEGVYGEAVPEGGAVYAFYGDEVGIRGVLGPAHADVRWEGALIGGRLGDPLLADLDEDGRLDMFLSAPTANQDQERGDDPQGAIYFLPDAFGVR